MVILNLMVVFLKMRSKSNKMADKDFEEKYYEFKNDIAEDYLSSEFESHWCNNSTS